MSTTDTRAPVIDRDGRVLWAPMPDRMADELYPGLWVGGCGLGAGGLRDPLAYHVALTVCSRSEETLDTNAILHRRYPLRDDAGVPPAEDLAALVAWVVEHVRAERQVLVRCYAGLNRSALIGVLALAELTGLDGPTALHAARRIRSPHLLCNPAFAALVEAVPGRGPSRPTS